MTFVWTARFERAYRALSTEAQTAVNEHLRLMEREWRHPSLHTKKLHGVRDIWYIRISRGMRLTFERHPGAILLRNVGPHDPTLRAP